MPLPQIFNPAPLVVAAVDVQTIPAQPEKTYPDSFLLSMNMHYPRMVCTFRPYNYATGDVYPKDDKDFVLQIQNVGAEAARSTLFAQVMGGIVVTGDLQIREKTLLSKIEGETDPDAKAALEVTLAAVRTSLGVS